MGRARPGGLTDEQKRSVCSSTLNMMAYLVHGSDAIGKPMDDWRELEPGAMHWAPAGRDLRTPEPGVGVPALAAYYWVQVCRARLKVNVPMALPDVGKLTATVKTLRGRMTHEDLVQLIDDVTKRWPEVTSALSWMSSPPQLDELTLHSRHVVEVAKRLASGQSIHKPAPVVGVGTSEENENLIKERYANLF